MKTNTHHPLALEGYPFILGFALLGVVAHFIFWPVSFVFLFLTVFSVYFFRNPKRIAPVGDNLVITPADGKVIVVQEIDEKKYVNQKVKMISVFMSPLNVHVNKMPMDGTVEKVQYQKGSFKAAFAPEASTDNEQNAVLLKPNSGGWVLFVQVAGWLARRIISYAQPGQVYKKGDIYGLIRFGSRVDVYLPLTSDVKVKVGDIVKSGESVLAEMK